MKRPLILVCNDDGIHAPGIAALVEAIELLGDVVIVAPDSPQSGMGHAVTVGKTLRIGEVRATFPKHKAYETTGTPADCVKLAVDRILPRKPDLLVSGINHGSNSSINVIYSGTMSAAVEGAISGIPAIGFSLCNYAHDADFTFAKKVAHDIAQRTLRSGIPKGIALNVNIPAISEELCKGYQVCCQADSYWSDNFEERTDPYGRMYYWMVGNFVVRNREDERTDEWALANNYVSIVPVQCDLTAHTVIDTIRDCFSI